MNIVAWFQRKYLRLGGRLPRKTYFIDSLVLSVLSMAAVAAAVMVASAKIIVTTVLLVGVVVAVVALFAAGSYSLLLRRFHDFNFSGWWLIPYALPGVIFSFAEIVGETLHMDLLRWSAMIAGYAWSLAVVFVPGTAGDNKFGPPVYKD